MTVLAALVGAGAVVFFDHPAPRDAAGDALSPSALGPPVDPEPPASDPPPSAATPPRTEVVRTNVSVEIESTPPGAEIELDGRAVGRTPADVVVPRAGTPIAVRIDLAGHEPHVEEIVPDVDQRLRIVLEPVRGPRRPPATKLRPGTAVTRETGEGMGFRRFD